MIWVNWSYSNYSPKLIRIGIIANQLLEIWAFHARIIFWNHFKEIQFRTKVSHWVHDMLWYLVEEQIFQKSFNRAEGHLRGLGLTANPSPREKIRWQLSILFFLKILDLYTKFVPVKRFKTVWAMALPKGIVGAFFCHSKSEQVSKIFSH